VQIVATRVCGRMDRAGRDYLIIAGWMVLLTIGCRYVPEIWLALKGAGFLGLFQDP
jgi:hypothetical protein